VSRRERRRAGLRLAGLAVAVGGAFLAVALSGSVSSDRVRDAVDGWGLLAPVAYVLVSAVLTVACFPGPVLAAASGLLFGALLGGPTAIVAAVTGACAAFLISRHLGSDPVDALSGPRIHAAQDYIAARGFRAVMYVRLLPGLPFTLVNYAAGVTRVSLGAFAVGTALGGAPRAFAYAALGGNLDDLSSPGAIAGFVVLGLVGAVGLLVTARDVRATRRAAAATPSGSGTGSSSPAGRSATRP
jgi:uncharacterized membrane protein YdjX (TVP38/TMEM64 family)